MTLPEWDAYERSTTCSHAVIENGDDVLYVSIVEWYVGLDESSGGNGLRTTRYELHVHGEDDEGVRVPIEPWQMVDVGQALTAAGLRALRKRRAAEAHQAPPTAVASPSDA